MSEGSVLRLKCAIFIETFGESAVDEQYLAHSAINWHWKEVLITNNSRGCDRKHECKALTSSVVGENNHSQTFKIEEYVREYNSHLKVLCVCAVVR